MLHAISILMCLLFALINYIYCRKLFHPIMLMAGEWIILLSLHALNFTQLLPARDQALWLIFIGLLFYFSGAIVFDFYHNTQNANSSFREVESYELRIGFLLIIIVLVICLVWGSVSIAINFLRKGVGLWAIRYQLSGDIVASASQAKIFSYVFLPVTYAVTQISIYLFLKKRKHSIILLLFAIILIGMNMLTNAGRILMLYFGVVTLGTFLILRDQSKKMRINKKVVLIIGATIVAMIFLSKAREANLFKSVYDYAVSSISFMSIKLKEFEDYGYDTTKGCFSWFGIISPVLNTIEFLANKDYSEGINKAIELLDKATIIDTNGGIFNYFATAFFRFYVDFRYIGVALFSLVWGWISAWSYYRLRIEINIRTIFLYNIIVYSIVISTMTFAFSDQGIVFAIILLFIVTRRRVDNEKT